MGIHRIQQTREQDRRRLIRRVLLAWAATLVMAFVFGAAWGHQNVPDTPVAAARNADPRKLRPGESTKIPPSREGHTPSKLADVPPDDDGSWRPMKTAPRDGTLVELRCDCGKGWIGQFRWTDELRWNGDLPTMYHTGHFHWWREGEKTFVDDTFNAHDDWTLRWRPVR